MGTTVQWIQVVIAALVYGGGMLFWEARERRDSLKPVVSPSSFEADERKTSPQPILSPLLVAMWLLTGWAFGVVIVFPLRQTFSWPLVMIMFGPLLAFFAFGLCIRKWPRSRLMGWHLPK